MKLFVTLFLCACLLPVIAQEKSLVGTSGFSKEVSIGKVDVSIGEVLIGDLKNQNYILNQGLLAIPKPGISTSLEERYNTFSMTPNPAMHQCQVIGVEPSKDKSVLIFNMAGKIVYNKTLSEKTVNVSSLSPGEYIVIIKDEKKQNLYKTKILKL